MHWKLTATWMFVAVGIAEGAVTVLLPLVPSFETDSHYIALIDALVVGLISALAFVFLRWTGSERPRSLLQGDWVNAAVVFLVVAGFETALHPVSLGLQRIYPEFEAAGVNAFLMACVVSSVSGWIVYVEDRIRQLGPARGVRWQHIGGALLIGAFFCALCVSTVAAVREINKGILSFETRLETELGVSVSRSMALTEKLGRVAMQDVTAQHGRWTSDTFLMYIHEQISAFTAGLSRKMSNAIPFRSIAGPRLRAAPTSSG